MDELIIIRRYVPYSSKLLVATWLVNLNDMFFRITNKRLHVGISIKESFLQMFQRLFATLQAIYFRGSGGIGRFLLMSEGTGKLLTCSLEGSGNPVEVLNTYLSEG